MGPGATGRVCSLPETLAFMEGTPVRNDGDAEGTEGAGI